MDQLLFHPKVVHLPIGLAVVIPFVASGVAFAWWRGWLDRRAWVIVLFLQAALVGSAAVAMNAGEAEAERVEKVVAEEHIEAHEEAAEIFVWASGITLALVALPLILPQGPLRQAALAVACIGSALVLAFGFRAGEAGGRLVYQYGAAQVYVEAAGASPQGGQVHAIEEYEDEGSED